MLLYFIRHGDPIYVPDSLTPLGHRQAEAVGRRLALHGLDAVYSSPSNRARLTAQPTCEILKLEPTILPFCDEGVVYQSFCVPDGNGSTMWCFYDGPTRDKMNSPEVRALGDDWYTHPYFADNHFTEGVLTMRTAVDDFLASLGFRHDRHAHHYAVEAKNDQRIAIFAHQGAGLSFLSSILDIPYNVFCMHFDISHTGISVVEFPTHGDICVPRLLQHSGDGHLYHENLGTRYNNSLPI